MGNHGVGFVDLATQYQEYRNEIDDAVADVLSSGQYIMGPQVKCLEEELAAYVGVPHAICCSSGTDALVLALMALGIGPGDEVIVPDFTFVATAEAVALVGATPVFVDIGDHDFTLDPDRVQKMIRASTRCVIAVSLYGQCADLERLETLCNRTGLILIEDAAQSFGASLNGRRSCSFGVLGVTSFYPTKPLGCFGDGGALLTRNDDVARTVRRLSNHGQVSPNVHREVGLNARLDELQAAVLRVKLRHFGDELSRRRETASRYHGLLRGLVKLPEPSPGREVVWAQYTVRIASERNRVRRRLGELGVASGLYYPTPLHRQAAYADSSVSEAECPVATQLCEEVLSLPMHAFLTQKDVDAVGAALEKATKVGRGSRVRV